MATQRASIPLGLLLGVGLGLGSGQPWQPSMAQANELGALTAEPGSQINVRTGPGSQHPAQHYGLAGDRVAILGSAFEPCGSTVSCREWHQVRFLQSGAVGWVRGDFLVQGTPPLSDACHRQLAEERTRLNGVRNGFLGAIYLASSGVSPYRDRPHEMTFRLGGQGQASVLSSPQFMRNMGDRLIQACGSVSAVRYASDASGWHDIYGLINGQVTGFTCVDIDAARDLRWGEYYCGL